MNCRAFNLGQRCKLPTKPGSPYCFAHTHIASLPLARDKESQSPADQSDLSQPLREALSEPLSEGLSETLSEPKRDLRKNENSHRSCEATTRKGERCQFPPRKGDDFCHTHNPEAAQDRAESHRRSVETRLKRLHDRPSESLMEIVAGFESRTSIQGVLDMITRLTFAGRISEKRAAVLIRACSVASRNFDKPRTTTAGQQPHAHDWDAYYSRFTAQLRTIDPVLIESIQNPVQ